MIEGNYNNNIAFVHNKVVLCKLYAAGWPINQNNMWADDIAVEVLSSVEDNGYWYYYVWAPLASCQKVLMRLGGWQLFETAIDASVDHLREQKHNQLYKYAKCYHYKKPTVWQRIKDLLANRTSRAGANTLRPRPENNTQGAAQTLRPLPISNRGGRYERARI